MVKNTEGWRKAFAFRCIKGVEQRRRVTCFPGYVWIGSTELKD